MLPLGIQEFSTKSTKGRFWCCLWELRDSALKGGSGAAFEDSALKGGFGAGFCVSVKALSLQSDSWMVK